METLKSVDLERAEGGALPLVALLLGAAGFTVYCMTHRSNAYCQYFFG